MKVRLMGLSVPLLMAVILTTGTEPTPTASGRAGAPAASGVDGARIERLQIFYTSPVLVRRGERVLMPIQVVCATRAGHPCSAKVALATRAGPRAPWRLSAADQSGAVLFDLTFPASRVSGSGPVSFFLRAEARRDGGRSSVSVPEREASSPLSFYVTRRLPPVRVPSASFGAVRKGVIALSLRWGSGPSAAGLEPGRESATLGPSSFDVDRGGAIHLVDAVQDRIAVFSGGKLVGQTQLPLGAGAAIAVTDRGASYVADRDGGQAVIRRIDPDGRLGPALGLGEGIPAQVRTLGERAFVHLLPLDAWVRVPADDSSEFAGGAPTVGMPVASDTELLRVATERFVRLGFASNKRVSDPVELRFGQKVGDVPLAEPDGEGGYVAVVHMWRDHPPADQYQVVRGAGTRILSAFAVADSRFADSPPLGKFRLGRDGHLYQLTTSPRGIRILRFELGREGR
ncbi:MAG: hypothetical protein ACRDGU_04300 [Actinomycetota bacterium]